MPRYEDMAWKGSTFSEEKFEELQTFDCEAWHKEVIEHEELFIQLQDPLPKR